MIIPKKILITAMAAALLVPSAGVLLLWASAPAGEVIAAATDEPPPPPSSRERGWERGPDDDSPGRGQFHRGKGRRGGPDGPPPFWRGRGSDEMMRRMSELRKENPELAELHEAMRRQELKIHEAVKQLPPEKANNPDEEVAAKIRPLFVEMFELDIKRQTMEIEMMQEKLDRLKMFLGKKIEHRDRFIDMLVEKAPPRIFNDKDGAWGRRGGPPPGMDFHRKPPEDD